MKKSKLEQNGMDDADEGDCATLIGSTRLTLFTRASYFLTKNGMKELGK